MIVRTLFIYGSAATYDDEYSEYSGQDNISTYGTSSGATSSGSIVGSAIFSSTTSTYTLNDAAKAVLFKDTTTNPVKVQCTLVGCCSASSTGVYIQMQVGSTTAFKVYQSQVGSSLTPPWKSGAYSCPAVSLSGITKSSSIVLTAKKQRSTQWVGSSGLEINFYFDEEETGKTVSCAYNGSTLFTESNYTDDVVVVYNGTSTTIASSKTLSCKDKIMATDVVIIGKTLKCANKVMASDVAVTIT